MRLLIPFLLSMIATACMGTPTPMPIYTDHPDPKLEANLSFKAEGVSYTGAVILPRRQETEFLVDLPKETVMLFFNTCARQDVFKSPGDRPFKYTYAPNREARETEGSCVLLITAVTKSGEFYRGVIDFTNSTGHDLTASVTCNAKTEMHDAAALCHVKASMPTVISFSTPAIFSHRKECPTPKCEDYCSEVSDVTVGKKFSIPTGEGFCDYSFKNQEKKVFRLTTLGYTTILNVFPPKK